MPDQMVPAKKTGNCQSTLKMAAKSKMAAKMYVALCIF